MHDVDRIRLEAGDGYSGEAHSPFGDSEFEADQDVFEYEDPSGESGENGWGEFEFMGERGALLDDAEEMEAAADLLSASDDAELEQFLGKLFKKVSRKVRTAIRSPLGRQLIGTFKGLARKALPMAAGAAGMALGGPLGAQLAGRAVPFASQIFGLELESLSPEDQEFEAARRFVRLASDTFANAARARAGRPEQVVRSALVESARRHAPGLLRGGSGGGGTRSGRWVRRGNKIILFGV